MPPCGGMPCGGDGEPPRPRDETKPPGLPMAPCIFTKLRGVCMIFMHIAEVVVVLRDSTGANSVTARATARNAMVDGLREIDVVEAPPTFGNLFTPRFIKTSGAC